MTEPETFLFDDDGAIPNSTLPLLVYRAAAPADPRRNRSRPSPPTAGLPPGATASIRTTTSTPIRTKLWALPAAPPPCCSAVPTAANCRSAPATSSIVPAGVGHCNKAQSPDLLIVGAYPDNAPRPDQYRGKPAEHAAVTQKIAAVPPPAADPVTGGDGPLRRLWGAVAA